jgi:hypothetical protein
LLNDIVAFSDHGVEQAVAINLANSVAIAIFSLCSALSQPLDYPHLIIIYHFVLLIRFSGITHSTVHPRLGKSSRFGLKNCDTYLEAMPMDPRRKAADMKMPTNSLISKQWRDLKAMA